MSVKDQKETEHVTVVLPGGQLPLEIMSKAYELAKEHGFAVYLTTSQNLRLLAVPKEVSEQVKAEFTALGAAMKKKGMFRKPLICLGKPHCNLGLVDTMELSDRLIERFSKRDTIKEKIKYAIAGCNLSCSNAKITDIGIVAKSKGFDIYVGGKGGAAPQAGTRIATNCSEDEAFETIDTLLKFHDSKTEKKQRMAKLLDDPEFPFEKV